MPRVVRDEPQKIAGDLHFPTLKPKKNFKSSGDHLRDTRLESKNAYGEDFDGTCDIQSPKYKQKGPMVNKIGTYSGDLKKHG